MSLNSILIFTAGAAIGSLITWKLVKTRYENIANEEIASVKETFSKYNKCENENEDDEPENENEDEDEEDSDTPDYEPYYKPQYNIEEGSVVMPKKPYVISPDEFDEIDEYGTETLTYYADHVLTDDFDNPIEDVEAMVGEESLNHFGEYEEDAVYVRNERHKIDYEILLDERKYTEVVGNT